MRYSLVSGLLMLVAFSRVFGADLDSGLIAVIPPSCKVVSGVDVAKARQSRTGTYIVNEMMADQGLASFASSIGLDIKRDVEQMILIGGDSEKYVLAASGRFDAGRLSRAARLVEKNPARPIGVAFLSKGVLVMGDEGLVRATHSGGGPDASLREELERGAAANDYWFASTLSGAFLSKQLGDAVPSAIRESGALERISRSSGGLQFGTNDQMRLNLVARSATDARMLSGLLNLAGSLAHLQMAGNSGLALAEQAFSSMQVKLDGNVVRATSMMPDAQLARALASN